MLSFDSYNDNYYGDSLDVLYASNYTHRIIQDPKTFDVGFIKLGNQIKENLVKQTKYETSLFILMCLRAVINEQCKAKLMRRSQGDAIYSFVESMAIDKGYAAW